jgi:hypothetical protein
VQGRAEAALREDRWVNAAREVAQRIECAVCLSYGAVELHPQFTGIGCHLFTHHAKMHRQRDELLLGAVVQVAFDAAGLVGGGDDPRA